MSEHNASVVINAPTEQVFSLFSHFNDFPKFMSYVKEVTYVDSVTSHWVASVVGDHDWTAVNENWIEGEQIGWRSISGLVNHGVVRFENLGSSQTRVNVAIHVTPPAGVLGQLVETLGAGRLFETKLQEDLTNFANLVNSSPPGALDPHSSVYIFHADSAAAQGKTTAAQDATLEDDDIEALSENEAPRINSR
ncbi:MAG: SRPBCC family protein [Cytophagales bacterium]|nr:SRPBCC family protein [Armatimonadota bacterium]